MAVTNKQLDLETKVTALTESVSRLQASNSDIRDELVSLKSNYATLVNEMSQRLEAIQSTFQAKTKR